METSPVERLMLRTQYALGQGARLAWYGAQEAAARRVIARLDKKAGDARPRAPKPKGPVPNRDQVFADITALLRRDMENVEKGFYPVPEDADSLPRLLALSRRYFADLPKVHRRQVEKSHQEVFTTTRRNAMPRYYLQNFHYQSGGWLSEESAELYDFQVEVLFRGAAGAMRRQALLPIAEMVREADQRHLALADIACGSGAFLNDISRAFPRLSKIGIDLSEPYLRTAQRRLKNASHKGFAVANAEALPLADASLDAVSNIYLFHELPAKVRRIVAAEFARVLKPGGRLIFVDSLQRGDRPDYDGMLENFPHLFHEPYYAHYLDDDVIGAFEANGLMPEKSWTAFLSKIVVMRKA